MRLNVDFRALEGAASRMGSAPVRLNIDVRRGLDPVDPIDIELKSGIEIDDLASIQSDPRSGLLSYEGRQVVLYIQDQGWGVREVMETGSKGTKVHVADCSTLKEMRYQGRYERYVATNDVGGNFYVTGEQDYAERVEGRAKLRVCKNCLSQLNYRGYKRNRYQVFQAFKWSEFFEEYNSHFARMPARRAGEFDGAYAPSWAAVSGQYRQERDFICEKCGLDLKEEPRLLHVHHMNGVKTDNRRWNLRALCIDCHRKQPGHQHMRVVGEDIDRVKSLRWRQGLS